MKASGLADSPLFIKPKNKSKEQPRRHATMVSSNQDGMISAIRAKLLHPGKEPATYRLTIEEKKKMAEIIFTLKMKNKRITENEIIRIALNAFLYDYEKDKTKSILTRLIQHR